MTGKRYADGVINVNTAKMEVEPMTEEDKDEHILGMILAQQFMMHVGLKKFGDRGEKAVTKELTQLHDLVAFLPVKADELSDEERKEALAALMFLTEKRDGTVKGRGVANVSKQRAYIPKEDATSPTATIEGIFFTSAIEAHEGRDVATIDCPGAFLSALSDEHVHMVLKGKMAELMVMVMVLVDPVLYRKYVTMENGKPALYVKVNKALYGLLRSALLFYKKLVKDLEGYGFKVSDYDPCVATKETATGQMTVTWHVDDLKVSHKDPFEITMFAEYLAGIYGDKLTVHRGKIHDYLGMDLDFSKKGAVRVSMIKYLHKILEGFPEAISGTAATPAGENLFKVRDETDRKLLPEEQAQHFHRTVAQLLFLSCRARRDIQTAVAFLTTRVKEPDEDDWKKLIRVLKYLNGTKYMKLTLTVDSLNIIRWWVDSSYMTHEDCKGHNGGMMTLGRGAVVSMSGKQKLNVRSSTECELVGAYDILPTILWCKYFIESLGYEVEHNILMQDNKSAILLEKNGRMSSSKRTKHIRARYFLIKDKVDQGDLEIKYCPTDDMWADINTKPLQGSKFYKMRAVLMNVPVDYDDEEEMLSTPIELLPDRRKVLKKEVLDALELMMSNGE